MPEHMKIVAVKECSAGNESVGEQWVETAIFTGETTLRDVVAWAAGIRDRRYDLGTQKPTSLRMTGRVMLTTPDEPENPNA